jgi:predicted Zn-dependent protease
MLNLEKLEKLLEIGDYADIRINFGESNSITLKDGKIEEISSGFGNGVAVRVLYKNGWGFVTSNNINEEEDLGGMTSDPRIMAREYGETPESPEAKAAEQIFQLFDIL